MHPELVSTTLVAAPRPRRSAQRLAARSPGRARHAANGERCALVLSDLAAIGATSFLAGATWPAVAGWAVSAMVAYATVGLYRLRLRFSALDDAPRLLFGAGVVVAVGALLSRPVPAMGALAVQPTLWPALLAFALTGRAIAYAIMHGHRRRTAGSATLIVGSGDVAVRLAEALRDDRGYGLAPIGLVGPPPVAGPALPVPLLGPVDDLDGVIAEYRPDSVVVAFAGLPDAELVAIMRHCRRVGIAVYVVPRLFELAVGRTGVELVHGTPLVPMRPEPGRRWRAVKRAVDVTGALAGLALLAPVMAACALAVRLESGRAGVIFRQERVGRRGRPFTILKFRSLTPSTDLESRIRWNIGTDDRVGPVGRLLRGSSLDELPQLLNVLRGDMSLVGPRPERPYFVEQFQRAYAGYADRHRVPGGITGWAQIHGLRGDTSIEDRVRFDNYYVENWSPALDLKIIVRTVGSMLSIRRR